MDHVRGGQMKRNQFYLFVTWNLCNISVIHAYLLYVNVNTIVLE